MILTEKIKSLPTLPGIYLMKDSFDHIIYVGKAKNLKRRVQSYFLNDKNHSPKVQKLVKHLRDFDYILTDTEFEALLLECKYIHTIQPLYNRMMKNPQSYSYITIRQNKRLLTINVVNQPNDPDENLYFGPFTSKSTVEHAIQGLKDCFRLNCSHTHTGAQNSACINYTLGLCMGVCLGGAKIDQYNHIMNKIIALLQGTDMSLLDEMKRMMQQAAENFEFEKATKYRDDIQAILSLLNIEKMITFTEENHNIVISEYLDNGHLKILLFKRTKMLFSETYDLETIDQDIIMQKIKENIFTYFECEAIPAQNKLARNEMDEAQIIYRHLQSNKQHHFLVPKVWLHAKNSAKLDKTLKKLLSTKASSSHWQKE